MIIIAKAQALTPEAPAQENAECCVVVLGTTMVATAGLLIAVTTVQTAGTTTTACVFSGLSNDWLLVFWALDFVFWFCSMSVNYGLVRFPLPEDEVLLGCRVVRYVGFRRLR